MARYGSGDVAWLLINGMNVLGDTTELEDTAEALVEETTALGEADQSFAYVGVSGYKLSQKGYFNDAANRSNAAFETPGATGVVSFAPEGDALGKPFYGGNLVQADYKRKISRAALHKAEANYELGEGYEKGVILHPLGAETADGDTESTSHDNSASSTDGGAAYLQVTDLDLDGYDDIQIDIIDSDDDNTFGVLASFSAVSAAPTGERVEVAGTIERYTAVAWDFEGSGTSPSCTFMAGVARA